MSTIRELSTQMADWILSRPPELWPLIREFPPACIVKHVEGHEPFPTVGCVALVVGYAEGKDGKPPMLLVGPEVSDHLPGSKPSPSFIRVAVDPLCVELVSTQGEVTREAIAELLRPS